MSGPDTPSPHVPWDPTARKAANASPRGHELRCATSLWADLELWSCVHHNLDCQPIHRPGWQQMQSRCRETVAHPWADPGARSHHHKFHHFRWRRGCFHRTTEQRLLALLLTVLTAAIFKIPSFEVGNQQAAQRSKVELKHPWGSTSVVTASGKWFEKLDG